MKAYPFSDTNLNIKNETSIIEVDAAQFHLTILKAYVKLVSCAANSYGLCASTEANPELIMNKYLPNDQYWIGGTCVSCPTGWAAQNGRCFRLFDGPLDQPGAQFDCQAKNSTLANVNSQAKKDLIKSLIQSGVAFVLTFL